MQSAPEIEGCVSWRFLGIPVLFHWSFPLVGLGIGTLVLAHELGHAIAAKAFSMEVDAIVIANIGGMCLMGAFPSAFAALVVSAAGILVQLIVLTMTLVLLATFGAPTTLPLKCIVIVFTGGNVLMMILNLLPYGARDGALMFQAARAMWGGR